MIVDGDGMVWYSDFGALFLDKMDPKTGKVTEYPIPRIKEGFPVGTLDLIGMLDPKTRQIKEWAVPTAWSNPYDVAVDKNGEAWTGSMLSDRIVRLDTRTGQFTEYLLPNPTNIRRA